MHFNYYYYYCYYYYYYYYYFFQWPTNVQFIDKV